MGITIKDVAALAGVSPATVSRVLTGTKRVAPETASRVNEIVERFGYQPDRVAQAMRRQRFNMVGLIVDSVDSVEGVDVVEGVTDTLAEEGINVALAISHANVERERRSIDRLLAQGIDGLLLVPAHASDSTEACVRARQDVPVVLLGSDILGTEIDVVRTDHDAGMRQVLRHLTRRGVRSVALIDEGGRSAGGMARMRAFVRAAEDSPGLAPPVVRIGRLHGELGRTSIWELADADQLPDAILCGNSQVLDGVVRGFYEIDRPIGGTSLVVMGAARHVSAPENTLRLRTPVRELVEEGVRLLLRRVAGFDGRPENLALPPSLVLDGG